MNAPEPQHSGPSGEPESWQSYVPEPVEKPPSIRNAVRLMYVGAVLSALNLIGGFFQRDEIRDVFRDADSSLSDDDLDARVDAFLAFGVVIGLISIGLWIWMARANGQGRSWARIVATVLGGLWIVSALANVALDQTTSVGLVFIAIGLVLAIAILVLLYRPDASRYYDAVSPS